MGKTVLVDLSHPFGRGNPLWPSNGDFHIDRVQHMPMHYRLLQTFNDFHMHNSTHADSPSHVIPESPYTHELPLENYYGPAVCLDIPKKHWELITVEDIEKFLDLGADRLGTSRAVKLLTSGEAGSGY